MLLQKRIMLPFLLISGVILTACGMIFYVFYHRMTYLDAAAVDLERIAAVNDVLSTKNEAQLSSILNTSLSNLPQTRQNFNGLITETYTLMLILLGMFLGWVWIAYFYLKNRVIDPIVQLTQLVHPMTDQESSRSLIHVSQKLQANYESLHQQVRNKNREIVLRQQLEKQKNDFIAMVSHELRTPITSQKAYLYMLNQEILSTNNNEKIADYMKRITAQTDKLTHLINNLLEVSRMYIGQLEFTPHTFNFRTCVNEAITHTRHLHPSHRIEVTCEPTIVAYGDQEKIKQVIIHLLDNAIKYSPKADRVEIKCLENQTKLMVTIRDYGIGIEPQFRKKIFERFYRVHSQDNHTYPGLGVGLNVSAEIIKHHLGKMWVVSQPKKGSVFGFTLPLRKDQYASQNINN